MNRYHSITPGRDLGRRHPAHRLGQMRAVHTVEHIREGPVGTASAAGFALAGSQLELVSIRARPPPRAAQHDILDED